MANCKYYKLIRQVSYNGGQTWQNLDETKKGDLYETDSIDCADSGTTLYRWTNMDISTDYYCSGTTKYYKQIKQVSSDNGQTWQNVSPAEYQWGASAQSQSTDCGYAPPTPTGCTAFIVDGGTWEDVPQSGASTCDSAFLYIDGIPQFTPASASSWVTIQLVHWDEDPHTYEYFCTLYTDRPCVANNLMYYAGIVSEHLPCSSSAGYTPMEGLPQIVQDTITGNTQYSHALGTIRYNVAANNEGADRSCTIRWVVDSEECPSKDFTITQLGGSTPTGCTCTAVGHKNPISNAVTTSRVDLGTYSGTCSGTWSATLKSGTDFLSDFRFSNGTISAKVSAANTGAQRSSVYTATIGECSDDFTVVQAAGNTPTNAFKWKNDTYPTAYTATTSGDNTSLALVQISSVLNGTNPNAVISSNDSWIITNSSLYVNNNEIKPYETDTATKHIYFNENDTSADRTGTVTFTQKGTSNTITLTIVQKKKVIDCYPTSMTLGASEVCLGNSLSYTYTMSNTACTDTVYFTLIDAGGHMYDSETTPSGGSGSGTFSIPSTATTGQASVTIDTTHRYYVTINECTPIPSTWSVNLRIANNDSNYHCIEDVEIFLDGYSTSIQTGEGECVNAGGEENLGTVTFPNSASAPEGSTITRVEAVVNDGSGAGVIKELTTNKTTLTNGDSYLFTLPQQTVSLTSLNANDDNNSTELENTEESE